MTFVSPDSKMASFLKLDPFQRLTVLRLVVQKLNFLKHTSVIVIFPLILSCLFNDVGAYRPNYLPQTRGRVWPQPRKQEFKTFVLELSSQLDWKITAGPTREIISCAILEESITRHKRFMDSETVGKYHKPIYPVLKHASIHVTAGCLNIGYPSSQMDENYTLLVEYPRAQIKSAQVWGALRAIESFSQLVYPDKNHIRSLVNETSIVDSPVFAHRGFLMDTSRHYLTMQVILKHLDGMEASKLNVLHWHIVDDQSFPFQSTTYPRLSLYGAFNPHSHVFTHSDIRNVIEEARLRGIRVIPEFDLPAHTRSWGYGHPELFNECSLDLFKQPGGPILDANKNYTVKFIENLLKEVSEIFADRTLFLGGDEFDTRCWFQTKTGPPEFQYSENVEADSAEASKVFFNQISRIVQSLKKNKVTMFWQEVLEMGGEVSRRSTINVWKPSIGNRLALDSAVRNLDAKIVVSNGWYLDHVKYGEESWRIRYDNNIFRMFPEPHLQRAIIGGESCLWGEFVDSTNFLQQAWPDTAPMAEKLWSSPHLNSYAPSTDKRLNEFRCRLILRGIPAKPIQSSFCDKEWTY